jgi:Tfp pilus assembly protein PilP
MTQTMRRTKSNLAMGLSVLLLAAGTSVHAQVNPATVKTQAQKGVSQAQQTHPPAQGQPQNQAPTKPPSQAPKSGTTPATRGQGQTPAKPPATPGTKAPAANASKPPATKPPAVSGQQPPKTPPTNNAATQKQKNPPAKMAPPPKTAQSNHPAPVGPAAKQAPPKSTAKTPAKTPAKAPAPATTAAATPAPPPVRRDPFVMLVGKKQAGSGGEPVRLPPGRAGLQVNTLVIQGILSSPSGMIAVVANPQRSVYFLHVGDQLFDGRVEKIEIGAVTFHEVGKDAFGHPIERQVTRKLNPSLGEQP